MHCPNCGANIPADEKYCQYCGYGEQSQQKQPEPQPQVVYVEKTVYKTVPESEPEYSSSTRLVALIFCILFGYLGVHRFYMKKPVSGILYLLTLGILSFGWIYDIIILLFGNPYDGKGRPMKWLS